jgi:hypothetical protein
MLSNEECPVFVILDCGRVLPPGSRPGSVERSPFGGQSEIKEICSITLVKDR